MLPRVPLSACLQRWEEDEEMGDYFSAALGRKTKALKHQRFASFPPFLLVQLNRQCCAPSWHAQQSCRGCRDSLFGLATQGD